MPTPIRQPLAVNRSCPHARLARKYTSAYKMQTACAKAVVELLKALKEENWCLPVMYVVCLDLRLLAQKCEAVGSGTTKPGEILESAAECMMACFRVCAVDNRASNEDTKRLGMLYLVNQLLKIYFRINKINLCKPLIRAIDSSVYKDHFPVDQQITYKYFVGRKAMFDSDYKAADALLSWAFQRCPRRFATNKRLILIYLVPVRMLLGHMPRRAVLQKYDVLQFWELAEALRTGNVRGFDEVIGRHEAFFIECGIYLIVEKLKIIGYRNLFKRVWLITQSHQLDLQQFLEALRFVGEEEITLEETHCIVANLIFDGKIKGYISHQHNKLVVSKQNPFPALTGLFGEAAAQATTTTTTAMPAQNAGPNRHTRF